MNDAAAGQRSFAAHMRTAVGCIARTVHVLLLSLLWILYELICRVRTSRQQGISLELPRVAAAADVNMAELMRKDRPVIIEGLARRLGLADALSLALLRETSASGLWIGSRGVVTPLHLDCWQGLLFQLHGSKKVSMYAPEDGSNLYLTSPFSVGSRFSILPGRSREADPARFSRVSRATRYDACLQSGEVLYIPPFWLHEIEALEPNISIPFRFKLRIRDYVHPRSLRAMWEGYHARYLSSPVPSKQG